jgi:CheY-like chemotaxis protein
MAIARILVVDDEPIVLRVASSILSGCGYEVISAPNGRQALEILQVSPTPDLVLSDMEMPGIKGQELLEEVKHVAPSTARMLMSGHAPPTVIAIDVPFLAKPFTPDKLVAAVQHVLCESRWMIGDISSAVPREPEQLRQEAATGTAQSKALPERGAQKTKPFKPKADIEDLWLTRVKRARVLFNLARERARTAGEDGSPAFRDAQLCEYRAREEYMRVLQIFSDLILHGKFPEE